MPSSRWNHIPLVLSVVKQLKPASILDVGVGFGKWGHLFREYLDIVPSERDPDRYYRENWKITIDGIEGYAPYITPAHEFFYNNIFIGDMREMLNRLGCYDVIFLGDVIEHVEKSDGVKFLTNCIAHSSKAVIVTTPARWVEQGAVCNNELEVHRSIWTQDDFAAVGPCQTIETDNKILVAIFVKNGVPTPRLSPIVPRGRARIYWRIMRHFSSFRSARQLLN